MMSVECEELGLLFSFFLPFLEENIGVVDDRPYKTRKDFCKCIPTEVENGF